jgi:hypothetical protein
MAPRKAEGSKMHRGMSPIQMQTFYQTPLHELQDAIKSLKQVYDILEHEIINYPDDSTEEDDESFSAKLILVAQSELHKVVARARIIPYNDMISWALEHVDIQTRSVIIHQKTSIDSFQPENLQVMYNISSIPKYTYNATFFLDFERK